MSYKLEKPYTEKAKINFIVEYNHRQRLQIKETDTALYALEPWEKLEGDEVIDNTEEYEQEQAQKERERLDTLYMTRSDFFDGMIMAFGLDSKELRVVIENILNNINITPVEIKVALNNYDNALNFYRKHTLFTLLNGVEIPINEDITLVFTSDIWDKFFDTKDYKELQKAIQVEPEPEPTEEENSTGQSSDASST